MQGWESVGRSPSGVEFFYPLYALTVPSVLSFGRFRSHEDVWDDLVQWSPELGPLLFVSHQWTSYTHPDPTGAQFDCLKKLCANFSQLASTTENVLSFGAEGARRQSRVVNLTVDSFYIWLD